MSDSYVAEKYTDLHPIWKLLLDALYFFIKSEVTRSYSLGCFTFFSTIEFTMLKNGVFFISVRCSFLSLIPFSSVCNFFSVLRNWADLGSAVDALCFTVFFDDDLFDKAVVIDNQVVKHHSFINLMKLLHWH